MPASLTDAQITELLAERKPLPSDYRERVRTKPKRGHKERELDLKGAKENEFRLIFRQSNVNLLDFSVILAYLVPKTNQVIRLKRYNGKSHEHTNKLENQTFYDFHIHMATERYQRESGMREDSYAQTTDRYQDFQGAIQCMFQDCGFDLPVEPQMTMFEEGT